MEAIILAGGLGTRLRSVVSDVPKPMADIGGKPFLFYLFAYLKSLAVDRFIVSSGFKYEIIEKYFGSAFANLPLLYSIEEQPLGTGGAIKKALSDCTADHVIVVNGDTFFPVDLTAMMQKHINTGAAVTIALKNMTNFDRYGTVTLDDTRIVAFREKQLCSSGYINGGTYIIRRDIFHGVELPSRFSFEADFLVKFAQSFMMTGFVSDSYFIDIGIPDDYEKARIEYSSWLAGE
ncbi:MAG: NTP transferase domain-containing protein [Geobacteraceae bacterium]|nr:NTP transferase domain-containing protein [Geobacteraceae bacterium]